MIAILGGGPAGLIAAEVCARAGQSVTIYDRMPSLGRKFLMAGRGGLNLTHSEPLEQFLARYGSAADRLAPFIRDFPPEALTAWSEELGQACFVGSSGRIFPTAMKASPLLRACLRRLDSLGVHVALRHQWLGWTEGGALRFRGPAGDVAVMADAAVLALGGASWPKLGSDGAWAGILRARGVPVASLRPANCGFRALWSDHLRERFAGTPLKPLALSFEGVRLRGEAVITATGIEGGGVYAHAAPLRDAIERNGAATLTLDLAPDRSLTDVVDRLSAPRRAQSLSSFLKRTLGLSPIAIALNREINRRPPESPLALATLIKALPLPLIGTQSIDRAISTAGGVPFEALSDSLMLMELPGVFIAGEMLDWEAPTGGYLLQASFATGFAAARGALRWVNRQV